MDKKEKIKELQKEREEFRDKANHASSLIATLRREIWMEENGIKIGDNVSFLDGRETKTGELVNIDVQSEWTSYPKVRLFKKNGSLGDRIATVYSGGEIKLIS